VVKECATVAWFDEALIAERGMKKDFVVAFATATAVTVPGFPTRVRFGSEIVTLSGEPPPLITRRMTPNVPNWDSAIVSDELTATGEARVPASESDAEVRAATGHSFQGVRRWAEVIFAPAAYRRGMSAETRDVDTSRQQRRAAVIAVVVFLAIAGAIGVGWGFMSGQPERTARKACFEAVRGKINSPADAAFTVELADERNGTWMVAGHVDSDRRYRFDCDVTDGTVTSLFVA